MFLARWGDSVNEQDSTIFLHFFLYSCSAFSVDREPCFQLRCQEHHSAQQSSESTNGITSTFNPIYALAYCTEAQSYASE